MTARRRALSFLWMWTILLCMAITPVVAKHKNKNNHSKNDDALAPFNDNNQDNHHDKNDHSHPGHVHDLTTPLVIHISCMMVGWGLLIPSAICAAHFLRNDYRTTDGWFQWHFWLNTTGLALALIGWFVAVVSFQVFDQDHKHTLFYKHGVMGCITMGLGLLQPVNALIRPSNHPTVFRKTWNYIHKFLGYSCWVLSVITILIGTQLVAETALLQHLYLSVLVFLAVLVVCLWYDQYKLEQQDGNDKHSLPSVEFTPIVSSSLS